MASPSEGSSLPGGILSVLGVAREAEIGFGVAFPRLVATGTQYESDDQPADTTKVWPRHRRQIVDAGLRNGFLTARLRHAAIAVARPLPFKQRRRRELPIYRDLGVVRSGA
jgi:hypothetical protein